VSPFFIVLLWILLAVSLVFGRAHLGQAETGMIENVWDGLLPGALYLVCGRTRIGSILIYPARYPGIR
jgi:hypothetical protein